MVWPRRTRNPQNWDTLHPYVVIEDQEPEDGALDTLRGPRSPQKWSSVDHESTKDPTEKVLWVRGGPQTPRSSFHQSPGERGTPRRSPPRTHLVLGELGGVLEDHVLLLGRGVAGGQGQAAQGVPPRPPLLDDGQDLLLDGRRQRHPRGAHPDVVAAVDDALGGALRWGHGGGHGVVGTWGWDVGTWWWDVVVGRGDGTLGRGGGTSGRGGGTWWWDVGMGRQDVVMGRGGGTSGCGGGTRWWDVGTQ